MSKIDNLVTAFSLVETKEDMLAVIDGHIKKDFYVNVCDLTDSIFILDMEVWQKGGADALLLTKRGVRRVQNRDVIQAFLDAKHAMDVAEAEHEHR